MKGDTSSKSAAAVAFGLCVFSLCFQACCAVKIQSLEVPEAAIAGHSVHLTCDYDLEGQRLHQVKWYKGTQEFYRYSPSTRERAQVFPVENLLIDFHNSDERTVVLKELHVDMMGRYTCEVSTDGNSETVKAAADMIVVAIPRSGPHMQGYKADVSLGDELQLNCTSLYSKPAANLQFFINNEVVSNKSGWAHLRRYTITNEGSQWQTESAVLCMQFRIQKHHVHQGRINVRCRAFIMQIYQRDVSREVFVKTHEVAKISNAMGQSRDTSSSASDGRAALSVAATTTEFVMLMLMAVVLLV